MPLIIRLERLEQRELITPDLMQRWKALLTKVKKETPQKNPLAHCKNLDDVVKASLKLLSQGENLPLRLITHLNTLLADKKHLYREEIKETLNALFIAMKKMNTSSLL